MNICFTIDPLSQNKNLFKDWYDKGGIIYWNF